MRSLSVKFREVATPRGIGVANTCGKTNSCHISVSRWLDNLTVKTDCLVVPLLGLLEPYRRPVSFFMIIARRSVSNEGTGGVEPMSLFLDIVEGVHYTGFYHQ
jgi:hypothetical protein